MTSRPNNPTPLSAESSLPVVASAKAEAKTGVHSDHPIHPVHPVNTAVQSEIKNPKSPIDPIDAIVASHAPCFDQAITLLDAWFEQYLQPATRPDGATDYLLRRPLPEFDELHRACLSLTRLHAARLAPVAHASRVLSNFAPSSSPDPEHPDHLVKKTTSHEIPGRLITSLDAEQSRLDAIIPAYRVSLACRRIYLDEYIRDIALDQFAYYYIAGLIPNPLFGDDDRILGANPATPKAPHTIQAVKAIEHVNKTAPALKKNPPQEHRQAAFDDLLESLELLAAANDPLGIRPNLAEKYDCLKDHIGLQRPAPEPGFDPAPFVARRDQNENINDESTAANHTSAMAPPSDNNSVSGENDSENDDRDRNDTRKMEDPRPLHSTIEIAYANPNPGQPPTSAPATRPP